MAPFKNKNLVKEEKKPDQLLFQLMKVEEIHEKKRGVRGSTETLPKLSNKLGLIAMEDRNKMHVRPTHDKKESQLSDRILAEESSDTEPAEEGTVSEVQLKTPQKSLLIKAPSEGTPRLSPASKVRGHFGMQTTPQPHLHLDQDKWHKLLVLKQELQQKLESKPHEDLEI